MNQNTTDFPSATLPETETCACGGEMAKTQHYHVNSWINAASAYYKYEYTCEACGDTGKRGEKGGREGALCPPEPVEEPWM